MTSQRPHPPSTGPNAVAWALLSQTIWLPLLAIDLHDQWQARIREQREIAAAAARMPKTPLQTAAAPGAKPLPSRPQPTTGVLLGSANRGLESASRSLEGPAGLLSNTQGLGSNRPSPGGAISARATRGLGTATTTTDPIGGSSPRSGLQFHTPGEPQTGLLTASFRRSELLGGSLTLADLQRPAMPSLAMAERARWATSSDPLAPLPTAWREPMRRAIQSLSVPKGGTMGISGARVVHIPSSRVSRSTPVPLAVQGDGSVDILSKADDPAVVEEIRNWSKRQAPSGGGGVTAAIVHLEPMPEAPPVLSPSRPLRPTVATRQSQPSATITPLNPASATRQAPAPAPRDSVSAPMVQAAPIAAPAPVVVQSQVPAPAPAPAPEPPAAAPAAGAAATP